MMAPAHSLMLRPAGEAVNRAVRGALTGGGASDRVRRFATVGRRRASVSERLMQVFVSGRHIDLGDGVRERVETRLAARVGKYFHQALDAQVQFSRSRHLYRSDISVHARRGVSVQAHGEADDVLAAFEIAAERVEKRLRRFKRRLTDHHGQRPHVEDEPEEVARQAVIAAENEDEPEPEAGGDGPVTIAESTTPIRTLTVGEAVMRLELASLPVLMFRDRGSGRYNVVYRRDDGNIGWLDPAERG